MSERGQIKWFDNRAGWGFIARPDAPDVYVRHDRIVGPGFKVLHQGDWVEYELRESRQGPYAIKVALVKEGTPAKRTS